MKRLAFLLLLTFIFTACGDYLLKHAKTTVQSENKDIISRIKKYLVQHTSKYEKRQENKDFITFKVWLNWNKRIMVKFMKQEKLLLIHPLNHIEKGHAYEKKTKALLNGLNEYLGNKNKIQYKFVHEDEY